MYFSSGLVTEYEIFTGSFTEKPVYNQSWEVLAWHRDNHELGHLYSILFYFSYTREIQLENRPNVTYTSHLEYL